ncbi:MAG: transposase [Acidobacteriota bacterium]|nr:transposase [Acidobacteriota bacterium]
MTWRLGDSLPQIKLAQWREEREFWLKRNPRPWDSETAKRYRKRFSGRIDNCLDQGSGSCILRDPALSRIVADALRFFDGQRYELAAFVVMPNHVHVLFRPLGSHRLGNILRSWKLFTARQINRTTGRSGKLWEKDYWDRLIRDEMHFMKCLEYIRENPEKAELRDGEFLLFEKVQESRLADRRPMRATRGGRKTAPAIGICGTRPRSGSG